MALEKIDQDRSCFHCRNFELCFLRHRMNETLNVAGMINIDSEKAPAKLTDVYFAVGNACFQFVKK